MVIKSLQNTANIFSSANDIFIFTVIVTYANDSKNLQCIRMHCIFPGIFIFHQTKFVALQILMKRNGNFNEKKWM